MKIICIGDVNTMRHIDKLYEILPNTKYIECYTFEELEKKIHMVQEEYFDGSPNP